MRFSSLLVSLLFCSSVMARGNKTKAVTVKSLCKEMASLVKLVDFATNTTKLDDKTRNNATKIAEIQAKASDASKQLAKLQSNATLASSCAVISAAKATENECHEMKSIEKLIALAGNETALATKSKGNETRAAEIQAKASTAATKLATLQKNATLVDACDAITSAKASRKDSKKAAESSASASSSSSAPAASSMTKSSAAIILDVNIAGIMSTFTLLVGTMIIL